MFRVQDIVVLISLTVSVADDILDYEGLEVEPRPLPPELSFISSVNKTDSEMRVEECMNDYGICVASRKVQMFCAINKDHVGRLFYTLCELNYENCKEGKRIWEYINDGECTTKISQPERTGTRTDPKG